MAKKIRLIDEEAVDVTEEVAETVAQPERGAGLNEQQIEQFLKYAEAIDWKLWEILKILRANTEETTTEEK